MFDQQITFLYVSDLQRSAAFYGGALGLDLALVQEAGCRIYRSSASSFVGLCAARPDRPPEPGGVVVCFVSDDVDGWYGRLRTRGVATEGAPVLNEAYGIYHFYLRDPDGYLLEIQRFESADWPAA